MASAKRKQDERNLKILRELVSQPGNKECFDCRQRGPTYVNMTIGSFICTSCSGMLRGLTPPHRVKSISMATFTQEEIDLIKERGNEYCRRIWLGLLDSNPPNLDTKDEQKMKDLMSAKYELKRYYLDPSMANQNTTQKTSQSSTSCSNSISSTSSNSSSNQTAIPRVPLSGTSLPVPLPKIKNPGPINANSFAPDFVADFSKVPDPFIAAVPNHQFTQPIVPQPSFANFDNNPVFDSTKNMESTTLSAQPMGLFTANFNGISVPPSEDRYAALKDLDSLMKQTQLKEENNISSNSTWDITNSNATNPIWPESNQARHVISNPFTSGDLWRPSANLMNNNFQSVESPMCNPANPFRPMQFPGSNDHQWLGIGAPGTTDVIPSSQLMAPLSGKAWQPSVTAYHANPFMVGTGVGNMARNSNNPFL
ncbi:arf-GAP domain and FG repeat-containing protein 1 [Cephus cinctus]|uniref:Arf-GAP domain and FG repeat-containing protein 1 n=1 Tax=Cephus cinctus TaxID=211228 RepID=A0AAJ7FTN9_CEPCN|nr:arf-GAP domain and FG repeat-containing protein 1 [Cephus cinctus]